MIGVFEFYHEFVNTPRPQCTTRISKSKYPCMTLFFFHYNAASFMKKAIFSDGIWTTV